jgi:endonuclease/exonuclease/phosphatase family metal-dependent hydrolase
VRESSELRIVTLNLWGEQGPLAARWPAVVAGLRALDPDVVLLQEVRQIPGSLPNQAETLASALGLGHAFAPTLSWGGGDEGLAILCRHPLRDVGTTPLPHATEQERRILLAATAETSHGPVGLFTTHLNYRLGDGQKREDQIVAAERVVAAHPARVKIWGGDFNASPDADEIRWLRGLRSVAVDGAARRVYYQDAFLLRNPGEPGFTWSAQNPHIGALSWLEPNRRIDYLFVSHMNRDGSGAITDAHVVLNDAIGGVLASDHYGVSATVRVAPR